MFPAQASKVAGGQLGSIYVTVPPVMEGLLIGQRCWISAAVQHTSEEMRLRASQLSIAFGRARTRHANNKVLVYWTRWWHWNREQYMRHP